MCIDALRRIRDPQLPLPVGDAFLNDARDLELARAIRLAARVLELHLVQRVPSVASPCWRHVWQMLEVFPSIMRNSVG